MCGIAGLFDSQGLAADADRMQAALELMRRRGPDSAGTWQDDRVLFGHRRLAIVDLSPAGHQPMISAEGRYVITFNGEIYNHAELRNELAPVGGWRGSSDTETLLAAYQAWGPECLARLNGMFAFAIWDRVEKRLFVARDRLGVKPLYYAERGSLIAFASRPGALRALDERLHSPMDGNALRVYLELGYIPAPLALHEGVRKLPPAHYLLADERGVRVVRYWDFRHLVPDPSWSARSEDDLLDELDQLVKRAVRLRLMSDVPLGAFLSGGVDSALIAACMCGEGNAPPRAFTIGFAESDYDESESSARIARHLRIEQTTETLSVTSLLSLLPQFVEEYDEPFADSSAFPTLALARLAGRHVKVALSGDGGDEAFGGYHYYGLLERLRSADDWRPDTRRFFGRAMGRLPNHRFKLLAGALQPETAVEQFHFLRGIGKDFGPVLDEQVLAVATDSRQLFAQFAASLAVDLRRAEIGMRLDTGFLLPNLYLQKVDVASMAYSVEARCPFTDYQLVEWAMRLPLKYKLRRATTKYLLKKLLARYLPAELVYTPKKGFGVPVAAWLRGPLKSWAQELFNDTSTMNRLPLDRPKLLELLRLHCSGARDAHPLLWAALMLVSHVARHERGMTLPDVPVTAERAA
ncbi:MAG: asparagine synthase (glutamine-hydrolyzing) [Pseudomonadota bacterium]